MPATIARRRRLVAVAGVCLWILFSPLLRSSSGAKQVRAADRFRPEGVLVALETTRSFGLTCAF